MLEEIIKQFFDNAGNKLNNDELVFLYNQGVKAFQLRNYSKSLSMFLLLVQQDPTNVLFVKALASAMQGSKDYINAALIYKYAYSLDMEANNELLFYAGICFYEAKQYNLAESSFTEYIKYNNDDNNVSDKIKTTKMYLNIIQSS